MKLLPCVTTVVFVTTTIKTSRSEEIHFLRHIDFDSCDVSQKVDCGHVGTTQPDCEASGCCWVPSQGSGDPWCFYKSGSAPSCPLNFTSTGSPFSKSEVTTMRQFFEQNINIQGSGAVVASPDTNTPGGSYYYHWERDGALSMQALLKTAGSVVDVKTQMDAYVQWVTKVQQESDPHGQSVLAEPKYMIPGGEVFQGAWCRPQNDGPGLRSHTLIDYANALDDAGLDNTDLWPVIQIDLDWQAANWQDNGCDLWEEVQSNDFFWNRFTQRAALTIGSRFANKMGDSVRTKTYSDAAKAVADTLNRHYANGYIFESDNRLKDAAVIAALNDGYLDDGVFSPAGQEAAGTVKTLNGVFCNAFTINQDDTAAGVPGILYGRYDGDKYAGGNPWILLTSALAELLYRGAREFAIGASDAVGTTAWANLLGIDADADSIDMATAMAGAGDGVLVRLRHHVEGNGFHLTEQIDRSTGTCIAAKDLTWSYACTLKAMHARGSAIAAIDKAKIV